MSFAGKELAGQRSVDGGAIRMQELRDAVRTTISGAMLAEVLTNMHRIGVSDARGAPNAARIFLEYVVKLGTQDQVEESVRMLSDITNVDEARALLMDFRRGVAELEAKVRELGG